MTYLKLLLFLIASIASSHSLSYVTLESFGAIGDGINDDTNSLQEAVDSLEPVKLLDGKVYKITSGINLQNNTHIYSEGGATIFMSSNAGEFDNISPGNAFSQSSSLFYGYDKRSIKLESFRVEKVLNTNHYINALTLRKSSNLLIKGLDISGFSKANGIIKLDTIESGLIDSNIIHDSETKDNAQLTAITIDNDAIEINQELTYSKNITLSNNAISRLNVSSEMANDNKYETDGINIAGIGASNIYIVNNTFIHVGEAVDSFGQYVRVEDNYIYEPFGAGVKFVHGASNGRILRNEIFRPALQGIVIAGSNSVFSNTEDNLIMRNSIYDPGAHPFVSRADHQSSGIALLKNGSAGYPTNNLILHNVINDVDDVDFGVFCEHQNNVVNDNTIIGTANIEGYKDCPN